MERPWIMDALSMVRTLAGQILIDIRDHIGIRVRSDGVGEKPAERCCSCAWERGTDPRLDDAIGSSEAVICGPGLQLIQWVGQCLDLSPGAIAGKLGIAVKGDDDPGCLPFRSSSWEAASPLRSSRLERLVGWREESKPGSRCSGRAMSHPPSVPNQGMPQRSPRLEPNECKVQRGGVTIDPS